MHWRQIKQDFSNNCTYFWFSLNLCFVMHGEVHWKQHQNKSKGSYVQWNSKTMYKKYTHLAICVTVGKNETQLKKVQSKITRALQKCNDTHII